MLRGITRGGIFEGHGLIPRRCGGVSSGRPGGFARTAMGGTRCITVRDRLHPPQVRLGNFAHRRRRTFEGTWTATGMRHTLTLGTDHRASIFDLTGSLLLIGNGRLGVGFRAQAIGFSDTLTGMQGRCVWTDEHGDKIYSQLQGEFVSTGKHIVGTFLGGTGRSPA